MTSVKAIIDQFADHPSTATMDAVISAFRNPELGDEGIAHLAIRLAHSGELLTPSSSCITADIPSTGGPSSLSTLLCPLFLVLGGVVVPKLGVPGRPAGGIDIMMSIRGFQANLTPREVSSCLTNCGYAHFLAGPYFAPGDAELFSYRQKVGAGDVASLAIASLLSKKLAVGVTRVALDVRVAPWANFGLWDVAKDNARRFVNVAARLGIDATCLLTDASIPYQNSIGRGEALVALWKILQGTASAELTSHVVFCQTLAGICLRKPLEEVASGELARVFREHLKEQGTDWVNFETKVKEVISQPTATLTAARDGYVHVDLNLLRRTLTHQQEQHRTLIEPFADPCGVVLTFLSSEKVSKGAVIGYVRSAEDPEVIATKLTPCFDYFDKPFARRDAEKIG